MIVKISNVKWLKYYKSKCIYQTIHNDSNDIVLLFLSSNLFKYDKEMKSRIYNLLSTYKNKWSFYNLYGNLYSESDLNKVCCCTINI